ncbi:hypothetical protein [Aurantiacibacter aquimixticola]|uniref:hypothetical protein n=1 Tax=Aurantiacibacter aquimixticola TaxID=1958945 RepID=UPI0010588411|nr:hypothetical protein [Aurantiacibacter aquimixticola]
MFPKIENRMEWLSVFAALCCVAILAIQKWNPQNIFDQAISMVLALLSLAVAANLARNFAALRQTKDNPPTEGSEK